MIEIGQSVGNYNVTATLGEGGMGMVYLAEHPVIGRKAALKVIHPQFARSPEVVNRFITEAKSINQIGHAHIVDITDFGTTPEGDFYFIMEYLQGASLAEHIEKDAPFSVERALGIAVQIAEALQASHDHGVIHRDLKPDNIMLVAHGDHGDFVKVLDFGLAKLVGQSETSMRNTRSGTVVGTPYYMAPEQCEGKVDVDHRADVYALGVLIFEMLTGKVPFGGSGYGEVILKHMTKPAPAARSLVPELPPALDAILFRALAKDPAHRFQSMAELAAALADPEAYAAAVPERGIHDDLSGRMRAARPMKRSEIRLTATPVTLEAAPSGVHSGRSTLREGVGEVAADVPEEAIARNHRGRGLVVVALVAGAAVMLVSSAAYKPPLARVVAAVHALSRPTTVRLNFSSDPDGATVTRADGTALGLTPLSIETAYGDVPTAYEIRKAGFVTKKVDIVPNLPSPIFAELEREAPVAPPVAPPSVAPPTVATLPAERLDLAVSRRERPSRRQATATVAHDPAIEGDAPLPLTDP